MTEKSREIPANVSIFSMPWMEIPAAPIPEHQLFETLKQRNADVLVIRTSASGRAPIRYTPYIEVEDHTLDYAKNFGKKLSHAWDASYVAIIDRPVLLDVWYGSLFVPTSEGIKIIQETLYISGQRKDSYFENLRRSEDFRASSAKISFLEKNNEVVYLPILNIQSAVYFHMMSEALLQSFVFASTIRSNCIRGVIPQIRRPVSDLAVQEIARFGIELRVAPQRFVWLPRAGLYSCFHQHARMNPDYHRMTDFLRRAHAGRDLAAELGIWKLTEPRRRRLYITRVDAAARPLVNETEVINLVAAHGFEVVDPGRLSFADQIALFASASVVIGPHGAGLTNAGFCDSNSTLIELRALNRASQSPSRNETYRRLSACCGLQYGYLMFDNAPFSEGWRVELGPLARVLRRIEDDQGLP